jgi:predicted GH43/DUF377 family glycosyl hydrolase
VACTDENTVGRIGFVDVDPDNPSRILEVSERPVLDIGTPGSFDENGVVPTCVVEVDEGLYLYYVGYQLGYKVRYFQFEGLAISKDGGQTFHRCSRAPIIDRSDKELLNRASAFVMMDRGIFKMWYIGGSEWVEAQGKMLPKYNMRYLESIDGKTWGDAGVVCLDFKNDDEHAFAKPWVIKDGTGYKMFYSIRTRSKGYRLGYAESNDGLDWIRKDEEIGIDVSESGWDSEMIEYSSIVQHNGNVYMFYCGNNCGETGFGYAVLE